MKRNIIYKLVIAVACTIGFLISDAQNPSNILRNLGNRGSQGGSGNDSLKSRNKYEDSITIRYYYLDSTKAYKLDSSINDFTARFPISASDIYLGNTGSPVKSLLFSPSMKAGWDPGFHAYDAYKWNIDQIRFYNTTRPYTELGYMLGSQSEQFIQVTHTQNIKPYWNFSLGYRLITAPGFFMNERSNHNNYLFTSWYQAPKKRYNNYFILLYNRLQAEENGGIKNVSDLQNTTITADQFPTTTNIGGTVVYSTNFFTSAIYTGHRYRELSVLMRQQYDFGKKDSIVTDSTVIPLFYPEVRFEHTLKIGKYSYSFLDIPSQGGSSSRNNTPDFSDTGYYKTHYNGNVNLFNNNDSIYIIDQWREINNDFSIYQFPDPKNLQQFIKLGAQLQLLKGTFRSASASLYNVFGHGEYRNRTKNQKWDMIAAGQLYFTGYNAGDYHAFVSLSRLLGAKFGSLQVGFENTNQSPSFCTIPEADFILDQPKQFSKENIIHFFGSAIEPKFGLQLSAHYYLVNNYLYLTNYYQLQQEKSLFNILRVNALKRIPLSRHWNWEAEVYIQQKTGPAPVNFPSFYTRDRIMYEGNLGFKNLSIAFGTELRYYTPYTPSNYSPVLGQFFYQDSTTISNRPEIDLFLHFRIKGFKAYIRMENLNTANFSGNGFHFNENNFAAPNYPLPGLIIRFGIFWSFVN